jgi:hypothetical protein
MPQHLVVAVAVAKAVAAVASSEYGYNIVTFPASRTLVERHLQCVV